jgi:hypothetical protein
LVVATGEGGYGVGCGKGPSSGDGSYRQPPESGRKILDHHGKDVRFEAQLPCGCTVVAVGHFNIRGFLASTQLRLHLGKSHKACHTSDNYQPPVEQVVVRRVTASGEAGERVSLTRDEVLASVHGRRMVGFTGV